MTTHEDLNFNFSGFESALGVGALYGFYDKDFIPKKPNGEYYTKVLLLPGERVPANVVLDDSWCFKENLLEFDLKKRLFVWLSFIFDDQIEIGIEYKINDGGSIDIVLLRNGKIFCIIELKRPDWLPLTWASHKYQAIRYGNSVVSQDITLPGVNIIVTNGLEALVGMFTWDAVRRPVSKKLIHPIKMVKRYFECSPDSSSHCVALMA